MKFFKHILVVTTTFLLASCAIDEVWDRGSHTEGEEVVMTFQPSFIDYSATTKAIGDGTQVDHLLVHVYETGASRPIEYTYEINNKVIDGTVSIPFIYGKEYKVYFFAYKAGKDTPYIIKNNGLKEGITISYPEENLNFNSLESLDAFYSVQTINLANNVESNVTLTRPFAQVNLAADKTQLLAAKATKVEISVNAATAYDFVKGPSSETSDLSFTFEADDYFQNNELISEGTVFLGTTYLFVQSGENLPATVTLYDEEGNVLKGPSNVEIPLVSNSRTNLVFTGVEPAGPSWDETEMKVPGADANGWIHITRPEQLAAFLLNTTADGAKVIIDEDIDMSETPDEVAAEIASVLKSVKSLTLNGNNKTISELNLSAFFNEATNLTVYDLTLSDIKVEGTGHVGVLVNTLKGESSFINVNVLNSSAATTDGAAGGMVGYIVRKSTTDRSESMSISIADCKVISTSATGKETAGKFVGKFSGYDNGETLTFAGCSASDVSTSADNMSAYVNENKGAWLAETDFSTYNSWLGDEVYYRGVVKFGENRFQPKWDGTKTIEPLLANPTYDGTNAVAGTNKFAVYSPFDLAGVRKKTASPAAIYLKADIDLNGQGVDGSYNVPSNFTKSAHSSADDIFFDPFSYVTTLDGYRDASTNNSIYNMSIAQIEQERAAFIIYASGTTVHKNINFRNCQTVAVHKPVTTDAKAYGAILVSNVDATYTMENVHAYDCKVFALQKIGTLGARISGTSTLKNNSVNNCYVENYECDISERFESGPKEMSGVKIKNVYADFYPHGEVGGMYGFIQGSSSMTNLYVNNTIVDAFGQDDKSAKIQGEGFFGSMAALTLQGLGYYLVPGRHVSTMIGNIRATGTVTLTGCSVDANTKCANRHDKHNSTYHYIGQAYIVKFLDSEGTVTVDGTKLTLADCNKNTTR